ncbi:hypothetical protein LKD22_10320 [Agathobaculum butyriciproducens]|uniref:Uncharacterized protein n=1 Tax=Agathobaculum butyriciproducens TaxID=1628085 RepID=A0AAW4W3F8_9FIRM|nr:hypothetical protein [Agathobaculum butyriciproducens]
MTVKVAPFSVIPDSADTKIATSSMKLNKFAFDKQQKINRPFLSEMGGCLCVCGPCTPESAGYPQYGCIRSLSRLSPHSAGLFL